MRILSLTATFGKLDHATLQLDPGLNVISAPNEWGKSTWCAFLLAMFYGIDTRQRSRQGAPADKERYQPWSGKPMEGSMDLLWQDTYITIERRTRGRIPMGDFRAYETHTGKAIPELTGDNCGLVLLGAEQSVYRRSGFITEASMAITPDEDLSRRLNQLVTTGDDSPGALLLDQKLQDLSRKCEFRSNGLLPKARKELEECQNSMFLLEKFREEQSELRQKINILEVQSAHLSSHRQALLSRQDQEKLNQVSQAKMELQEAHVLCSQAESLCKGLPSLAEAIAGLSQLNQWEQQRQSLEMEYRMAPAEKMPETPGCFAGLTPGEASERVRQEQERLSALKTAAGSRRGKIWMILACVFLLGAIALTLISVPAALGTGAVALLCGICYAVQYRKYGREQQSLEAFRLQLNEIYGDADPVQTAQNYADRERAYQQKQEQERADYEKRASALAEKQKSSGTDRKKLTEALEARNAYAEASRAFARARRHYMAMESMALGLVSSTSEETDLNLTLEETQKLEKQAERALTELRSRLDISMGRSQALPSEPELKAKEDTLLQRIQQLEKWKKAADLGLSVLAQAQGELQRRFAPKISQEASRILSGMTGGKYDRLILQQDMALLTACQGETGLRETYWRSTGTHELTDLALRLAVSTALIPHSPLVLDDVLAHLDDRRMEACLEFLIHEDRQILLFSCQNRERLWLAEKKQNA